jgi:hypothetical protein
MIRLFIARFPRFNDLGWDARGHDRRRNVLRHDRARGDERAFAHRDTADESHAVGEKYVILDHGRAAWGMQKSHEPVNGAAVADPCAHREDDAEGMRQEEIVADRARLQQFDLVTRAQQQRGEESRQPAVLQREESADEDERVEATVPEQVKRERTPSEPPLVGGEVPFDRSYESVQRMWLEVKWNASFSTRRAPILRFERIPRSAR